MQLGTDDQNRLLNEGSAALQQGRVADARTRFEQVTSGGSTNPAAWLMLAIACRYGTDLPAEEQALNRLLALDPHSILGLVMKGDCRVGSNDETGATYFYKAALRHAAGLDLPADVATEVRRAEQTLAGINGRAHARRETVLTRAGMPPASWSKRLKQSLDLAAGRTQLYLQQPTIFYYPELPQVQFFEREQFDWAAGIEAETGAIRAELDGLLSDCGTDDFRPYIEHGQESVRLDANKALVDDKDWSALFLIENGATVPKVLERCPRTWAAIQQAPLVRIPRRGPTAMFSLLKAGARIAAHTGMFNTRLVCHLPLIVPPNCRFRVGNEVRAWEPGKLLIFDDTIEHEAWNDSAEDRVVLIFDIWRPELSAQEQAELTALLSA